MHPRSRAGADVTDYGADAGDVVTLAVDASGASARQFRVAGAYEPTPDPMRFTARRIEARMHLPDLMTMTANAADPAASEAISAINVRLSNPAEANPIGIIRLIGISQRTILTVVLVEGLLIATAGAVFGILLALSTQSTVNHFFQWRYDTALVFVRVTRAIALRSIAISVPLGLLAGLAGSWTLLRRDVLALVGR